MDVAAILGGAICLYIGLRRVSSVRKKVDPKLEFDFWMSKYKR